MTLHQKDFVTDLKTELISQDIAGVNEWTLGLAITPTRNYEVFIFDSRTDVNDRSNRLAIKETSNFNIILNIKKSILDSSNIEDLVKTASEKIKTSILNVGEKNPEKYSLGMIEGGNLITGNDELSKKMDIVFNTDTYLAYKFSIPVVFTNSY